MRNMRWKGGNKHLYAIGSIIGFGCQDAVIWGSGILNDYRLYRDRIRKSSLDIRCVRGPKTRMLLRSYGVKCPEVYGDPAILLPEIYMPKNDKKLYDISVITHFSKNNLEYKGIHRINILTTDYKSVVDEIVASKLVISSSLHGIILSEIYGVPCVLLSENNMNLFKYEDYYYSTERYNIPKAGNIEEALNLKPLNIPDFTNIRENLRNSFPYDLFVSNHL
ncbi:Polysaccharide pyruvyl transferase [Clostridiales bacterium CHKCI001]|nr:Polysaccharide pyruvyl transferase [Clostridiales bacterium CHKCI001]